MAGLPGGPVVKNLPYNAGHMGSIPGLGTKIPHAAGQLSPRASARELMCPGACMPQRERENTHATTRENLRATTKSLRHNERSSMPQLRSDAAKKINKKNKQGLP